MTWIANAKFQLAWLWPWAPCKSVIPRGYISSLLEFADLWKVGVYLAFFAWRTLKDFICAVALSLVKIHNLRRTYFTNDRADETVKATLWATAEPGTGIIAASIAILRPLFRNIKSGVRDKLSGHSASKSSRSVATTAADGTQLGKHNDHEAIMPLRFVVIPEHNDPRVSRKTSMYSIRSPTEDPWDTNIEVQHAQVGQVIHVRMNSGPPTPPPKP